MTQAKVFLTTSLVAGLTAVELQAQTTNAPATNNLSIVDTNTPASINAPTAGTNAPAGTNQ